MVAAQQALHEAGFPTPTPIDCNRHCIVMSVAPGYPLRSVSRIKHPGRVARRLMELILQLARSGLIHCDFNEFNLMISDDEDITIIDFPQMVSTSHRNAKMYFDRDVQCIVTYFGRKHGYNCEVHQPCLLHHDGCHVTCLHHVCTMSAPCLMFCVCVAVCGGAVCATVL